ncbi:MAG: outer membrane beta-barrel protein [Cyclobacteriaceae bacterium]|nr:outer membrane beta-barrel protein [Cyclobacteriaceae bacterium]
MNTSLHLTLLVSLCSHVFAQTSIDKNIFQKKKDVEYPALASLSSWHIDTNSFYEVARGKESRKKAFTNQFDIDLFAGASLSSWSIDNPSISSLDPRISPFGSIEISRCKLGIGYQTGIGYLHYNYDVTTISADDRKLVLGFVDIPLMIRYTITPWFYVNGGLSVAFNVSSKADFDFGTGRPDQQNRMNKADLIEPLITSGKASAGFYLPIGLNIQVFYTRALKEILKDGSDGKTFSVGGIQIGYRLRHAECRNNLKQIAL